METLTLTDLHSLTKAITTAYIMCYPEERLEHGETWIKILAKIAMQIKDLQFEQEQNPLPFPEK